MVHSQHGRAAPVPSAAAGRLRPEDAARGAGRLPEGRRGDPGARGRRARGRACWRPGRAPGRSRMALCRAVGPEGRVVSYELREDFQETAAGNLETFFGKLPALARAAARRRRATSAATGERLRPRGAGPARAVGAAAGVAAVTGAGVDPVLVPPDDQPDPDHRAGPRGGVGYDEVETFEVLLRHGTSPPAASGPTTGWWRTRDSSPWPAGACRGTQAERGWPFGLARLRAGGRAEG